jgi:outer membrane protein assembly factor BamB
MSPILLTALLLAPADVGLWGESIPAGKRLAAARILVGSDKTDEAVAILLSLIETGDNELIPLPDGRSVRTRTLAQAVAATLPAEGLAAYRKQLTARARKWLEEGNLRRVVDEAFCTEPALDALNQLGDRAFLEGRFDEAELWWRCIAPLGVGAGPDLARLAYPKPPEAVAARARAKQLLARMHAGRSGWDAQLSAFAKMHPKAAGKLAGQEGTYADILGSLAKKHRASEAASDWPTFGGSATRGRIASGGKLVERLARVCRGGPSWQIDLTTREAPGRAARLPAREGPLEAARRLAFHPVVVGRSAFVADGRHVTSYALRDGKAETLFDLADLAGAAKPALAPPIQPGLSHTLTVADGLAFAQLGTAEVRDVRPVDGVAREGTDSYLVCVALREGPGGKRRHWAIPAIDKARKEYAVFEGAPLVANGRAFIAATHFDEDKVVTSIRCYPARLGDGPPAMLWRTEVCDTRELLPASAGTTKGKSRTRHHLLTRAGPNVVYCSHSGAIVALNATTGERAWAIRYPRREELDDETPRLHDLSPCLYAEGRLYVAPADSGRLLCLDPLTGGTLWQRDSLNVVQLLGVGKGRLIFSTWRGPSDGSTGSGGLRAVMAGDGDDEGGWLVPGDEKGLQPYGRGVLAGGLVLWPTARRHIGVIALRQEDGRQPDNPTLLHRVPAGNLLLAGGALIVTGRRVMHAFVPEEE